VDWRRQAGDRSRIDHRATGSGPVSPAAFVWFGNTGTYLLIGGMLAVEFAVRIWRFPDYRFKNPLQFAREARLRMPNIVAALKNG